MNSFKEFYSEVEEENFESKDQLNEDATVVIMAILGLPSIIALLSWAGSLFLTSYIKGIGRVTANVIYMWKKAFGEVGTNITRATLGDSIKSISKDVKVKEQERKTKEKKRAFEAELKEVYSSIELKDFNVAKEEFIKTPKYIRNNPDVYKVIISEISRVLGEPPIYIVSPGNETYKAIKKVINIRVAKAAAYASKMVMEKNLKKIETKEEPEEPEDLDTREEESDL